jgi:ubiquinone biosynthesis protein
MKSRAAGRFGLALSVLRDRVAASDLLPGVYARYRPLLADALRFFLERLPADRLERIISEQAALAVSTSVAERLVALVRRAPALHKLGQVVARDRRLSPGFRKRLQELESLAPQIPSALAVKLIERELPASRRAAISLGPDPLAEGSVAVVMPFTWRGVEGVFKAIKPGVERLLEEDLGILGSLGCFLDEDCEWYHVQPLDYEETFRTIRGLLLHEVRLGEEQRHLAEAARIYRSMPCVAIPSLLPFCTPRLTAMERIDGVRITDHRDPARIKLRFSGGLEGCSGHALGRVVAEALIARPLFAAESAALFHADPHAGNLLVTREQRVGILDWSLAGRLRRQDRAAMVQLLVGAVAQDAGKISRILRELSRKPPDESALSEVVRTGLRELRWGAAPGITWLTRLLDEVVLRAGARLEADLILFRKSLLTIEGVLADLTEADERAVASLLDEAVLATLFRHWLAEWPERLFAPPAARSLTTHLSAADLSSLAWSAPAAAARWWGGMGEDLARWGSPNAVPVSRTLQRARECRKRTSPAPGWR